MSSYVYCDCGFGWDSSQSSGKHDCSKNRLNSNPFVTKDSGDRQEFASGMKRDSKRSKVRYDLVDMDLLKRWAELMGRGAEKYGDNNWKKANSEEELNRFRESAFRHFIQWFNNENQEEDHAAAIVFNIAGAEFVKRRLNGLP